MQVGHGSDKSFSKSVKLPKSQNTITPFSASPPRPVYRMRGNRSKRRPRMGTAATDTGQAALKAR
jgi:hypothetical protein